MMNPSAPHPGAMRSDPNADVAHFHCVDAIVESRRRRLDETLASSANIVITTPGTWPASQNWFYE